MPMSTTQFDWCGVSDRLAGVRDDDLRSASLLIAFDVWQRRAARGKSCRIPTLCWRAVQLARRQAKRHQRIDVCSAAVESAPERGSDRPASLAADWHTMTDRQRRIAAALMDGRGQAEIAEEIGCSQPTVCREIERIGQLVARE